MCARVLALDFGTSNSAAAVLDGTLPRRIGIENGADALPTAVFFPSDGGSMRIGEAAGTALVAGDPGRYMRALKSILGTPLFHESRLIGGKRRTLSDVVTDFLKTIKQRAEHETGFVFDRALSGRPVHFHSADPVRDARAEADLKACYHAAGFQEVRFLFEPVAAAWTRKGVDVSGDIGLIVDIGGGTSDFTIFQSQPDTIDILASNGIRLGGTDFDREISMTHVMPLLGHGGQLRRTFGEGLLPVPNAIYRDLATWAKIPFLYSRDTERAVADMAQHAAERDKIDRLGDVIRHHLGHDVAFSVERGKIAANASPEPVAIDLGFVAPRLGAPLSQTSLDAPLAEFAGALADSVLATCAIAGITPDAIDAAILVGGSSRMNLIRSVVTSVCPAARLQQTDAFTAVVDGLALATAEI